MRIIKQGLIPEEVVYKITCGNCETFFEFLQKEGKFCDDQRDGAFVQINCPVCKKACTTAYITPQEYMRKKAGLSQNESQWER